MTNNTQLPEDWKHKIETEAKSFANVEIGDWAKLAPSQVSEWEKTAANWEAGAAEYATKLQHLEKEVGALKRSIETHKRSYDARSKDYDDLSERFEVAELLLKKITSRHEAGLLPDRNLYTEIKSFLDGTK